MKAKQKEFILLRSEGLSFDKIAKEIGTSKNTLLQWAKLFQDEIKDLEFEAMQKIKEEFGNNQVQKYKILLSQIDKYNDALLNLDTSEEKAKDILTVLNNLNYKLQQLEQNTIYTNTNLTTKCEIMGTVSNANLNLSEV